ncbi:hypothetical protein D9615_000594 [Tricholomella constricta]|uniref:O-methyltransferase dimerisation domain-containing protein n=1 Tax=Tricholomella constricta TaxID=117010 RepID=A0A8H5HQG8_9AGAR|nr:hypothetical protein D9615_000594 [Tricholomella constricta]
MSSSPIITLAKIISDAAANIDRYCTEHRVQLPELGDVFNPQAEFVLLDPFISEQASYIVGAAAQISTIVRPAPLSMMSTAIQFHVPSALRVAIETNTVEILRESGPKGLHVNDIAAKNKANPEKLARVLRLLATEHIFTEVSPDVFANNRLSSVVDTGKSLQELDIRPSEKHVGTSGLAALTGHFTDDVFKSSSHLGDVFSDASFCNSEDPAKTAFNLAFRTELPVFAWFDGPGNEARLHRFGIGMEGGSNMFPPQAVVEGTLMTSPENHGFDWEALDTGLVVDVGGGIGSQSLTVAKAHPNISFVIQDRESVVDEAIKFWEAERPEAVSIGRVKFQARFKLSETGTMSASSNQTPKRRGSNAPKVAVLEIASALIGLVSVSFVLFAYERALIPQYGSGPTTYLLNKVILASIIFAAVNPIRVNTTRNWLYTAIDLAVASNATYWGAVWTARMKDPVVGPALTHAFVLAPLVFCLTTSVVEAQLIYTQRQKDGASSPIIYRVVAAGVSFVVGKTLSRRVWTNTDYLNSISDSQIYLSLAGLSWCLWICKSTLSLAPTRQQKGMSLSENQIKAILIVAFVSFWGSTYHNLASPVLPHPLKETYTHPIVPLQIHSAVQSTTGLIVVGEALPPPDYNGQPDQNMHSVRYLRASHSILGGVWTQSKVHVLDDEPPITDSFGTRLGDSIYSTFVLQEAVRLVNSTQRGKAGLWENALIIGLGTGISATAFSRHGISTTIVEIDPAVYNAARTFFGLPDPGPGKVFLEDARTWAANKRESIQGGNKETSYEIVVHDCFSGGGVPEHIFTVEFWKDLKTMMHPEGIIVVNFAGILKTDSTRMVLQTLEQSFGQCRAFHDLFNEMTEEQYDVDFINVVFFCTSSKAPLTFRSSRKSDWLGSPLRRHVLNSLPTREVNLDLIRDPLNVQENSKYLLTDAHNPLGKFQNEQGLHHWKLMREVLPDVHWETY